MQKGEWLNHLQTRIPLLRLLEVRKVANAVLFLASPSTSGITGQNLLVTAGGRCAREDARLIHPRTDVRWAIGRALRPARRHAGLAYHHPVDGDADLLPVRAGARR